MLRRPPAGPSPKTFGVNSSELTTRLSDPLSSSNNDFFGVSGHEYYDVFYSDSDGRFNVEGDFVTSSQRHQNFQNEPSRLNKTPKCNCPNCVST